MFKTYEDIDTETKVLIFKTLTQRYNNIKKHKFPGERVINASKTVIYINKHIFDNKNYDAAFDLYREWREDYLEAAKILDSLAGNTIEDTLYGFKVTTPDSPDSPASTSAIYANNMCDMSNCTSAWEVRKSILDWQKITKPIANKVEKPTLIISKELYDEIKQDLKHRK